MAASVSHMTSLKLEKVKVTCLPPTTAFVAGASFKLPLHLTNAGSRPITWSEAHALHLSYRWLDGTGETLEPEGIRTSIPSPLAPGTETSVTLLGTTPDEPGDYRLRASLVLEGVHWACDVSELGWSELHVQVTPQPAWPHQLRNSTGGRALRGAYARAELARSLEGDSEIQVKQVPPPPTMEVNETSSPESAEVFPRLSIGSKVRNWIRRTLGILNLQRDLELVANAVTRQEQRYADLHQYIERFDLSVSQDLNGIRLELESLATHESTRDLAVEQLGRGLAGMHSDLRELASADREENTVNRLLTQNLTGCVSALRAEIEAQSVEVQGLGVGQQRLANLVDTLSFSQQELRSQLEGDAANRLVTQDLIHSIAAVRSEVQVQSVKSQGLRLGQQRLLSLVDTLSISQQELRSELEGGKVVVEIVSTLRNLEKWARSSQEGRLLQEVQTELGRFLQEVQGDADRRGQQNNALIFQADQTLSKLDTLLTRQALALASLSLVLVRNRLGLLAIQDDDAAAISYYLSGALPEAGTIAIIERLLSVGDCFLDVGANVGIYSLLAGRKVGRSGKVVAVEPMPSTFKALRTTLAINGMLDIVDAHECALGSRADSLALYSGETSGHSSLLESANHSKGSDVVTIKSGDDVLNGARPNLIKIDVEGWELEVLEGLRSTIERGDGLSIILECSPEHVRRKYDSLVEWMERIRSFGFKCWRIDDESLTLHPLDDILKIDDRGSNLLLSRRLDRRLRSLLERNDG